MSEVNRGGGGGGGCVTDYSGSVGVETERRGPAAHSSRSAVSASALLKPCDEGACQLLSSPLNCIRSPPNPKYNWNRAAFTAQRGARKKKRSRVSCQLTQTYVFIYKHICIRHEYEACDSWRFKHLKAAPRIDTLPTV